MRKTLFISVIAALLISFAFVSHGQEEDSSAVPEAIIVQPNEQEFSIEVSTDRQSYSPRERLNISLKLSHDAYVYVYDINPEGNVTLLYPNGFQRNNFMEAGKHTLPSSQEYSLIVSGPLGVDRIQVLALLQPIPILELTPQRNLDIHAFPRLSTNPTEFSPQVRQMIEIYAEPGDWAADWTEIVIRNPAANLTITTTPQGANIFINDQFVGQSPLQIEVPTGPSSIRLSRDGFNEWRSNFNLANRDSKELDIRLQPITPTTIQPVPDIPSGPDIEISADMISGFNFGFDVGANSAGIFSAGFDMGFSSGLGIGGSISFNEDEVPQYYNIGRPIAFPRERVFNLGPEVEAIMKISVPVGDAFYITLGGGIAFQERVHIATSQSTYVINAADILIVPNGYRDTINFWTVMGGIGLRLSEHGLLNIGHHNRRGWTAGLSIQF